MMFLWWLIKRGCDNVINWMVNKVQILADLDGVAIKEELFYIGVVCIYFVIFILSVLLCWWYDSSWPFIVGLCLSPIVPIGFKIPELYTQYRAEQAEKPKRKRKNLVEFMKEHNQRLTDRNREFSREAQELSKHKAEDDSSLAERTLTQFDDSGEWTGANPYGAEAYFKRLHADYGDEYFEDESGE